MRKVGKFLYMIRLGMRYIRIYKKTHFHPFMTLKAKSRKLSKDRQSYSNKVLKKLNIDVKVVGEVPKQNHKLYAINHRSLLDIIVMEHIFAKHNKNGIWIAKEELFTAFYGDFFRYSGCVSVDIENKRNLLSFFKEIKHRLSRVNDLNVYIFPEGERYKLQGLKEFQSGASKIAKTNKLDIIPVFINDTLESVFQNAPYKKTKVIEVHIGTSTSPDSLEQDYRAFMGNAKGNE